MSVPARLLVVAALLLTGCGKTELPPMKVSLTHETGDGEYVLCSHVTPGGDFKVSSFPGGNRSLSMSGSVTKQADTYGVSVHYQFGDVPAAPPRSEGLVRTEVNTQVRLKEDEWLRISGTDNLETIAIRIGQ